MADKQPASPKPPDLTPIFILLLVIIIAGLGSIRTCEPYSEGTPPSRFDEGGGRSGGCVQPQPSLTHPSPNLRQYTVLVGSFGSKEQASVRSAQLRAARINNFIVQYQGKWLVCVGKYWSAERAYNMVEILKNRGVSNPVVLAPKKK